MNRKTDFVFYRDEKNNVFSGGNTVRIGARSAPRKKIEHWK